HRVDDGYLIATLDRVRELSPDILVITGDFMSYYGNKTFTQLEYVLEHLPRGRLATIAILGNHDYGYGWSQRAVAERLTDWLRELGLTVLRNERCSVAGLDILGLDDYWSPC